jgi:exodeoxyribonuclease VII large subunit
MRAHLAQSRLSLSRNQSRLSDPRFVVAEGQQALDELRARLSARTRATLSKRRDAIRRKSERLYARHPRAVLSRARADFGPLEQRLLHSMQRRLDRLGATLSGTGRSLSALSPLSILGRGYALATGPTGAPIRDVAEVCVGDEIQVRVKRGTFAAEVQKVVSTVENHSGFDHESPAAGDPPAKEST